MNVALQATSTRWWGTHKNHLRRWEDVVKALRTSFQASTGPQPDDKYMGALDPQVHITGYKEWWELEGYPRGLWVHNFVHNCASMVRH